MIDITVFWYYRKKMDANLVTTTSSFVMNSTVINSASSVASSPVILLESPLILPNAQPDILQQALEAALPISTSAPAAGVVPKLPILPVSKTKEDYVTVFDSRDGTLRLSQENARALGINISNHQGDLITTLFFIVISMILSNLSFIRFHSCDTYSQQSSPCDFWKASDKGGPNSSYQISAKSHSVALKSRRNVARSQFYLLCETTSHANSGKCYQA